VGEVNHTDIGQMNMYLNYFKREENVENDSEPVGIILSKYKDDVLVEYATGSISNKLFVSKYQTYLPEKKVLQDRLKEILEENSDYHLDKSPGNYDRNIILPSISISDGKIKSPKTHRQIREKC
jgi:hypothetical protein